MMLNVFNCVILVLVVISLCVFCYFIVAPEQFDSSSASQHGDRVKHQEPAGGTCRTESSAVDRAEENESTFSVQVVVLGDIGRSPRMQYHARSLADRGAYVNIVGYLDSELHPSLRGHHLVQVTALPTVPAVLQTNSRFLFVLAGPLKALYQALSLAYALGYGTKPAKWMMVQNPPAIPVLAVARLLSYMRNTRLVVDWHNFGWSILALKLGKRHPLVKISEMYERLLGAAADKHIAVTKAMATYLETSLNVLATPLYDRPTLDFQPLTNGARISVLRRLLPTKKYADEIAAGSMRLLVSSTSWTPDEDFFILLEALQSIATRRNLPKILLVITGKGPRREFFRSRVESLEATGKLQNIKITLDFLSFPDYAALLGAADLGICLHQSTSGLDLPMKVVDMFGTGLPVVGWSDYETWSELVTEGVNGRGFRNRDELAQLLIDLLSNQTAIEILRNGALKESRRRWADEWNITAGDHIFFPEHAKSE